MPRTYRYSSYMFQRYDPRADLFQDIFGRQERNLKKFKMSFKRTFLKKIRMWDSGLTDGSFKKHYSYYGVKTPVQVEEETLASGDRRSERLF